MTVTDLLLKTLSKLENKDFKTFKWHLSRHVLDGCTPIPAFRLEGAERTDAVTELTQHYVEKTAVTITVTVLRKMEQGPLALTLETAYKEFEERQAASSTTQPSLAPAPPVPDNESMECHMEYEYTDLK